MIQIRGMANRLVSLIVPPYCSLCSAPMADHRKAVCPGCISSLKPLGDTLCQSCALPLPCDPCPAIGMSFDRAYARFSYEVTARKAVSALKFHRRFAVADWMAQQMACSLATTDSSFFTVVPVPSHVSRELSRGFNQAELLAKALARLLGLPFSNPLQRRGERTTQRALSRSDRLHRENVTVFTKGCIPSRVLLVDDVYTTGATLDLVARALKADGSVEVVSVVYARTLARNKRAFGVSALSELQS